MWMKDRKYLITYHNDNTGRAIWVSERYCFETTCLDKFLIMKATNQILREQQDTDIAEGIRMMLQYDGVSIHNN